ncbi:MAG: alanine racemase [Clostridia bacterium]|nr:alanine racemase [Clostridia bacterium]
MYRRTYLEVDCEKLKNNIINIRENYPNYKYYFGVVKANAYGHGGYIINSLIEGGVNYLAVSSLEEAVKLRKYNAEIPILILEPIHLEYLDKCLKYNFTITVSNMEYFSELLTIQLPKQLKLHIKLDTGMSRLGINSAEDLHTLIEKLPNNPNLFLEGIFTHFATSGINDKHWDNQLEKFKEITKNVDLSTIPIVHLGRSLTLVNHPKIPFCNGIRLGISMYGMSQSMPAGSGLKAFLRRLRNNRTHKKLHISPTTPTNSLNLQTAITLYSEVIDIHTIHKNDFVGYGALYVSEGDSIIATIPIGYADGIPKSLKYVAINNTKYEVVGEVCMDMISVKVDNTVKLYDKVTIIGGDLLPVKAVATQCGISTYTLFTSIRSRVPRLYKNGNDYTEVNY